MFYVVLPVLFVRQCHSAGTGSSSPDRVGDFEQPYGAQALREAVQKDCIPEFLAHVTQSC